MLGIKSPLKDTQKVKVYLIQNNLFDKEYRYIKDKNFIYFPVLEKFDLNLINKSSGNSIDISKISFTDIKFEKVNVVGNLKDNLSKLLTKEELSFVTTAHDTIGTIAIVEIPKGLVKREKIIAKTLLEVNPQIKTVLKKASIHSGTFRTQKMKYLGGENTKETIYRENGVQIKLDVEKVYFSIRLSNERKRISEMVRDNEEVLVMFSGCAPYPLVISKNSKARHITSVELNPYGHKYSMENLKLNHIHNITLVNENVHKFSSNVYQNIIGLKCAMNLDILDVRLKNNPKIMEIHLFDDDFNDTKIKKTFSDLEKYVKILKKKGVDVFIHMPMFFNNNSYDLSQDIGIVLCKKMGEFCKKNFVSAIIHLDSKDLSSIDEKLLIQKVKELKMYYDYFYFENLIKTFSTKESIFKIARGAGFKNICIDLAHLYIVYEDNKKSISLIKDIQKEFNTYFHIADHNKKLHTCRIEKGFVDFKNILPLVNKGIIEVQSKDEKHAKESIASFKKLKKYSKTAIKKYDRIVMPAPKQADAYLEDALKLSKKGTIIHFYDFLEIDKFDLAVKKIDKACKKLKLKHKFLDLVKCGQHSPYVYRICVDFEIL